MTCGPAALDDLDDIILPVRLERVAGPGRAGSATAAAGCCGARAFYDLFEAGAALTATDGLAPLWKCLAARLAEPSADAVPASDA
jgi:hypothetical protein